MEAGLVGKQAELLRISANMEACKAENASMAIRDEAPKYTEKHFFELAKEAQDIVNDIHHYG